MNAGSPIIVTALFAGEDHGWLEGLRRRHFPPERNQVPVHLTLFHHLPPGVEAELGQRLGVITASSPPRATIAGILNLGGGTAFRVESEELKAIRASLAEAFRGLLTPQDQAGWRPHITIQNKVTPAAAKALQQELSIGFSIRPLGIAGLQSWAYRGGPWQPIRRHPFRG
ncbi:2'-5' RNA ligase family protein [Allosphingosinicella flava]|uniref:2'-5' RNA ligase family protein n=1 Tax=Allosphingosinicella flava TaxID=2771430 RepID=UPI001CF799CD|nr:2'-5' RNA ligase family protein [Sphingosinicella flava]